LHALPRALQVHICRFIGKTIQSRNC
jgi:hypothetical protein